MQTKDAVGDDGFTLVELLMVIAMTGIIITAIASALTVGLRTTDQTGLRLSDTADTQLLSSYLPQDVHNAGSGASDVSTASSSSAGCTGLSGANVLALRWTDAESGSGFGVTYRTDLVDGENRLLRFACESGSTRSTVIARSLASPPNGVDVLVTGDRIRVSLLLASGYRGSVTAVRRTVDLPSSPPVTPTCTVTAGVVSPDPGTSVSGTLTTPADLAVTTNGHCGALEARYAPDGSTPASTALTAQTSTKYKATLQATGWTAGSRPISLFEGATHVSDVPWSVTELAPCAVTNVRTAPLSGTRSRNPEPAVLSEGQVQVTADFSATCTAAYELVYDPTSSTTTPTSQTLAFGTSGASRSVVIPSTTAWSDGGHTLLVREGSTTLATGSFTVSPAACSVTSLVLNPTSAQRTGSADTNGNKTLNKSVTVTAATQGVCANLRVSFTPAGTAQSLVLNADTTFSSWTVTVPADAYRWSEGNKTFTITGSTGTAVPGPTATLVVGNP